MVSRVMQRAEASSVRMTLRERNAFSNDILPLSTALLYTFALPGHSLFGLNNSNPSNAHLLAPTSGSGGGKGLVAGGIIMFGGGVPLYDGSEIIGGLGVSGDTACADHEIAKRVRQLAGLNPPGGAKADDIDYDPASIFAHPLCINTVKNGDTLSAVEVPVPLP
jgi:uncharacterized protein GlcG (DUF336 family)